MADENLPVPSQVPPASATEERAAPQPAAPLGPPPARPASPLASLWALVWPPTEPHVHQTESIREVAETVVFVVVLVLMLKSFAAEAFVIPTGSMATTLFGYQKWVKCPKCEYQFPVNCSDEVEPSQQGPGAAVVGCTCPNCRWHIDLTRAPVTYWGPLSGDRVLVAKSLYETGLMEPDRHNVVVFKYPKAPQQNFVPMNYIKRLIGLPGETIGIHYGDLYVLTGVQPSAEDLAAPAVERWEPHFMHIDDLKEQLEAHDPPAAGKPSFTILRKLPDKVLALRRIVFDNDLPADDLKDVARWADASGAWAAADEHGFKNDGTAGAATWLRYRHVLRTSGGSTQVGSPELITDFMGYNTWESINPERHKTPGPNWVGDLILECEATVEQPAGTLVLELAEGVDRFRARFDLASGMCTLTRQAQGQDKEEKLGDSKPTALKQKGTYALRFANVDDRLIVWVNGSLPFGDGVDYQAPVQRGPTKQDLEPASIGAVGAAVRIGHLKLWRDTYYTIDPGRADVSLDSWSHPEEWDERDWKKLRSLPGRTMYVQPGHFLCMGDNSPESSDGRSWGLVPERLMLGRALLVYYPFYCPVWPLESPVNRVGPIR